MLEPIPAAAPVVCRNHPGKTVNTWCDACGVPFCMVCLFDVPAGRYCPECVSKPSEEQQKQGAARGIYSVVFSFLGVLVLGGFMVLPGLTGDELSEQAAGFAWLGGLALVLTGLSFGLMARDTGSAKRSPLAIVGIVVNSILLALYLGLTLVGAIIGKG